jgi:hypothetical protein
LDETFEALLAGFFIFPALSSVCFPSADEPNDFAALHE